MAKKVTVWSAIGSLWTVFYLCLVVIVTIPDYPKHGDLWYQLTMDTTGYFHELWYLTIGYLSGIAVLMVVSLWHATVTFLNTIKFIGVSPDGKPIFYRPAHLETERKAALGHALGRRLQRVIKRQ